jgi:uncharacterized protein YggU (UPF0235/DUF167 family)
MPTDWRIRDAPDGALVRVRVRPRSNPAVVLTGEGLIISVAAPPAEGRATEEARRSLAGVLEVPPSAVSLRTGARSRDKVYFVSGLDAGQVRGRLRPYQAHRG